MRNACCKDGLTPLHMAARGSTDCPEVVRRNGWTPLHMAADRFTDCPEECEILLKSGAKIDAITTNGKQPLHLACSGKD
jgi:ankyrin repeat protein